MGDIIVIALGTLIIACVAIPFTYRLIKEQVFHLKVPKNRKRGYIKFHHD